jgi:hypothetical protein
MTGPETAAAWQAYQEAHATAEQAYADAVATAGPRPEATAPEALKAQEVEREADAAYERYEASWVADNYGPQAEPEAEPEAEIG